LTRLEIYAIVAIFCALLTYVVPFPQAPPRPNVVVEQEVEEAVVLLQETEGECEGGEGGDEEDKMPLSIRSIGQFGACPELV